MQLETEDGCLTVPAATHVVATLSTEDAARGLHPDYRSYMQETSPKIWTCALYCFCTVKQFGRFSLQIWHEDKSSRSQFAGLITKSCSLSSLVCVWPWTCSPQGPTSLGTCSWVQLPVIEAVKLVKSLFFTVVSCFHTWSECLALFI